MTDKRVTDPKSVLYKMICVHLNVDDIPYLDRELQLFYATEWCKEHFGDTYESLISNKEDIVWLRNGLAYYFKNEDDAIQFKLRWG